MKNRNPVEAKSLPEKHLYSQGICGKLSIKNGWVTCPLCGKGKVIKLLENTKAKNLIVFCKVCGAESIVNID